MILIPGEISNGCEKLVLITFETLHDGLSEGKTVLSLFARYFHINHWVPPSQSPAQDKRGAACVRESGEVAVVAG